MIKIELIKVITNMEPKLDYKKMSPKIVHSSNVTKS